MGRGKIIIKSRKKTQHGHYKSRTKHNIVNFDFRRYIFFANLHSGNVNFMWPTVTAHCSDSSLFYSNRLPVYASICHSSFSTIRGSQQLPANDCRAHNSFMFHFPSKLSSSAWQMNFQVAETLRAAALGPPGTPMQMFSCSFWLLVSFPDKTKTNKHPVRQEAKQLAEAEWHKDTERGRARDRSTPSFFFFFLIVDFHSASKWECGLGSGSMAKNDLITFIDLLFTHGWQNRQDS